jgi:RNA:NAD 2'-phosphotransferase (TPT1/KptA family)
VKLEYNGKSKTLSLQMKNIVLLHKAKKAKSGNNRESFVAKGIESVTNTVNKAMDVLNDPEIKALVESNPKFKDAVEDCINNPISFMKYMSDPEMSPLISKAMSKLKF